MKHNLGRFFVIARLLPVSLSLGAVLTIIGCASAEDHQRQARAADFNQWLGQDKQSRVRQVGPPDTCTQAGGGELCEWRPNGSVLRYRYDARGIAQSWTYLSQQLGVMERSEDQASQGGAWQAVKDSVNNSKFGYGGTGR
ncbi:MAG TPA: hypothetical protein VEI50_03465 [Nitrospiraceae bacterium]|nr:hypothetical protein [Nitrospiraceae bacterium]